MMMQKNKNHVIFHSVNSANDFMLTDIFQWAQ